MQQALGRQQCQKGLAAQQRSRCASRRAAVSVRAKVNHVEGQPRVLRGKAFVTKDVRDLRRLEKQQKKGGWLREERSAPPRGSPLEPSPC